MEDGESPVQGEERENLYPLLNQFYGSRDSWNKGRADKLKAFEASPLEEINNIRNWHIILFTALGLELIFLFCCCHLSQRDHKRFCSQGDILQHGRPADQEIMNGNWRRTMVTSKSIVSSISMMCLGSRWTTSKTWCWSWQRRTSFARRASFDPGRAYLRPTRGVSVGIPCSAIVW